jgi:hypothetical protein
LLRRDLDTLFCWTAMSQPLSDMGRLDTSRAAMLRCLGWWSLFGRRDVRLGRSPSDVQPKIR